eukprot:jgi/Mesvir1/26360/Mv16071-RA.1
MSAASARPGPPPNEGPLHASPLKARVTKSWSGGTSSLQPQSPGHATLGALRQNDQAPFMSSGDFHYLAACGHTEELAHLLISPKASGAVSARQRGSAAATKTPAKRELLPGVEVDVRDGHQRTMLTCAALGGHRDTCQLLLELGADPNASIHNACTPLHLACGAEGGSADLVALLLGAGASSSVNAVNLKGWTPLHVCVAMRVCQGGEAAREKRRVADAGKDGQPSWLWRPSQGASKEDEEKGDLFSPQQQQEVASIVRLLANAGASLDLPCHTAGGCAVRPLYGTTALAELLAFAGDLEEAGVDRFGHSLDGVLGLASTLVQCRAKVDAPDSKGCTHLWKACLYGHVTIAHWLLAHGAAHDVMFSGRSPLAACITGKPRPRSLPQTSTTASSGASTPSPDPHSAPGHPHPRRHHEPGAPYHTTPAPGRGSPGPSPGTPAPPNRTPSLPGAYASNSGSAFPNSADSAAAAAAAMAAEAAQQRVVRTLLVKSLLDAGADPNMGTALGATPLLLACVNGMPEAADLVIAAGAFYRCAPTAFPPHIPQGTGVLDVCLDREGTQEKGQGDAGVLLALVTALLDRRCLLPECDATRAQPEASDGVEGRDSGQGEGGEAAEADEYLLRCGGCQLAGYCCKEHQVADWMAHRLECPRMKLYFDERVARDAEGAP